MRRALNLREVLRWADAYPDTMGKWPTNSSGSIAGTIGETWAGVDQALRHGLRDLPCSGSLAKLLKAQRGTRHIHDLPVLTEEQILAWADAHHERTGQWPTAKSGTIPDSGGEKWQAVNAALQQGARKLPSRSSLARLLAKHRGVRNRKDLPPFTEEQILAWADAHFGRTGAWPHARSGPIADAPGETWMAVDMALRKTQRGMPGGSSLALLLAEKRDVRNVWNRPDLSMEQVLAWADAHHEQTGEWPIAEAGDVREAPGETWMGIHHALAKGGRGMAGGSSLARLLDRERGVRNRGNLPDLSRREIVAWASAHQRRTGRWPDPDSGPIVEAPGETWAGVNQALLIASRGLRRRSSLAKLLAASGKKRNRADLPRLSFKKILAWADAHHQRTGRWPNINSGPVHEAPGERWDLIDSALRQGQRRLTGRSSLARLLARKRDVRKPAAPPPLAEDQIFQWADLHRQRTGNWPRYKSGRIVDAPSETWSGVDYALRYGKRMLLGGSSLAKLLAARRK